MTKEESLRKALKIVDREITNLNNMSKGLSLVEYLFHVDTELCFWHARRKVLINEISALRKYG